MMKHVKPLGRGPVQAQSLSIGQILSVVAEILSVIGATLIIKDQPPQFPPITGSGGSSNGS